jgi:hypothetical protein
MKKNLLLLIAAVLLFVACGSDKRQEEGKETVVTEKEAEKEPESINITTDKTEAKIEELKKLKPISNESLKAILPEELNGLKRTSYNVVNMGFAMGQAEYKVGDDGEIKVIVYDCVGEAGSAFYGMNYFTRLNMEQEDENGYTKSVDFGGAKAIEHFDKSSKNYTLTYVTAERFLVSLEGRNASYDQLKSLARALDFSKAKS